MGRCNDYIVGKSMSFVNVGERPGEAYTVA